MNQIDTLYSQYKAKKISPENFQRQKAKIIASIIASKLNINVNTELNQENLSKIQNYFLREYVSNGYVAHSFPETYFDSIIKNSLIANADERTDKPKEIQEIQNIFMSKGIVGPMGGYPYYGGSGIYYEHDFTKVFQHAIDSPEWFNTFTSSDHITGYPKKIETVPYILRNEKDCRQNVEDLCQNANLNSEETQKVLDFYKKQYKKFSSPNP